MLNHDIKIHDRKQFEIKLQYPFSKKRREREYLVETYFFVPNVLGINKFTFHKKNFYDSVKNYIRFTTPQYSLEELLDTNKSPLNKIFAHTPGKPKEYSSSGLENYEHELKMFCAVYAASVRSYVMEIIQSEQKNIAVSIERFLSLTKKIITKYRQLEEQVAGKKEFKIIFSFGDEYISLVTEKYLYIILTKYEKNYLTGNEKLKESLFEFIRKELEHRNAKNYNSVVLENSTNEEMLFRFSALKKYFSSVLSLEADVEKEGTMLEHILFGIAA